MNKPRRTSRLYAERYGGANVSVEVKRKERQQLAKQAMRQAEAAAELPKPTVVDTPRRNGKSTKGAKPSNFLRRMFRRQAR